ncbi:MAG: lytic murein transglycosylase [Magnetococcales bacterium]|nr:lytic murein transglycosylase [Magnetococcales bacterium]
MDRIRLKMIGEKRSGPEVGGGNLRRISPAAGVTRRLLLTALAAGGAALAFPGAARADVVQSHPWLLPWVERDGFDPAWLERLLAGLTPDKKVLSLMDRQAEDKPYYEYRKLFLTSRLLSAARQRLARHKALLQRLEGIYGVPGAVLVALWGVESRFGGNTGGFSVLRTLFTLATAYPRRAAFFQDQLREFLLLCREQGWDPREIEGSYAGAMGQVQMIPTALRQYGVDFDQDGVKDVFESVDDVLASIAAYLQGYGWQPGGVISLEATAPAELWTEVENRPLTDTRPVGEWLQAGVVFRQPGGSVDPLLPAALIMLAAEDGPRYHVTFNNFLVITRWNRSRRFAMVIHEITEALSRS